MDLHAIFERTSSDWVRYSKYEYKEIGGREFLTPTADSEIDIYNPLDVAVELVTDALNLGALLCCEETLPDTADRALMEFTEKYGLLGFMTAIPLNSDFYDYPDIFFGQNIYFDVGFMKTKEYMSFFQPLGDKEGQSIAALILSSVFHLGKTPEYGIMFSRNYAEPKGWLHDQFRRYHLHFWACSAYHTTDNPAFKDHCAKLISNFSGHGLGFRMRMEDKPMLVWDFNSLKTALETVYAFYVTRTDSPLRMCRQCKKVYFAKHGAMDFCSGRCRNQYNVYKSRRKKRDLSYEERNN